ncbi:hypothetical protein FJZ36_01505 [Candidatus Poribacteria bacterium]|nr:hypothetical protein [Candidatus Poribacteria bacterium]
MSMRRLVCRSPWAARALVLALMLPVLLVSCRSDPTSNAIRHLGSGSVEERVAAAQVLLQQPGDRGEQALIKALESTDASSASVRRVIAEGIAKWGRPEPAKAAVAAMERDLASEDAEVRRGAVQVLAQIDSPESTTALVAALRTPQPVMREMATKALTSRGAALEGGDRLRLLLIQENVAQVVAAGRDALPDLTAMLTEDPALRAAAATAIGLIGEPSSRAQAYDAVLGDLASEDAATRARAVDALGALGNAEALTRIQNLAANDTDSGVRAAASIATYVLQKDIVSLISALRDPNPQLQSIAIRGIRNVSPPDRKAAVLPLVSLLRSTTNPRLAAEVISTLDSAGAQSTKPILDALGSEPEWQLRKRLAQALAQPGVLVGMNPALEVTLYNLYEKEPNADVKPDLAAILRALEGR